MTVLLATLAVQAATNYNINVGGVEVTTSNYNNVTGGDIESGTVTYNESTNTLTLTNVTIRRTSGSSNFALHNRNCGNLIVVLVGDNYLYSKDGPAIKLNSGTGMTLRSEGGNNTIYSLNNDAVFAQSNSNWHFYVHGSGHVDIKSGKTYGMRSDAACNCILGNLSSQSSSPIYIDIYGPKGAINWQHQVSLNNSNYITLKKTGNSSYPIITCGTLSTLAPNSILAPEGATFGTTTILKNGSAVYNEDIIVASNDLNVALLLNSTNFPDANFLNAMLALYPKGYLTQSDLNNLTSLNVAGKNISNMTGIEKLTALKTLYCYNNTFTSLDLVSNTELTYLDCAPNTNLTWLRIGSTNLETLYCYNTGITSLALSELTKLKTLYCYNTKVTSLTLANKPQLTSVDCHSCTSLTDATIYNNSALWKLDINGCTSLNYLDCHSNGLTSLNVTGNTALNYLYCYSNNNLSSITGLANCSALKTLNCYNCALTDLSACNSMTNLATLNCYNNKLTQLELTNKTQLTSVYANNNPNMTQVRIIGNSALTTLNISNCTALTTMYCVSNNLTSLNVTGNTALTNLYCNDNNNLAVITGLANCTALKELWCQNTSISDLSAVNNFSNLVTLTCYNTKITSLTLTNKSKLSTVSCQSNPQLATANIYGNSALTTLGIYSCPALTTLNCYSNNLTSLNLSGNTALNTLNCYYNSYLATITGLANCTAITTLQCFGCALTDLSACNSMTNLATLHCSNNRISSLTLTNKTKLTTVYAYENPNLTTATITGNSALTTLSIYSCSALTSLNCKNNALTSLNMSGCNELTTLHCNHNKLTSLNVSNKTKMIELYCGDNQLASLSVQGCTALNMLNCIMNQITGAGMTTMVNSLPTRTYTTQGTLYVLTDEDEGNVFTDSHLSTAQAKYWNPKRYDGSSWVDITASTPSTDGFLVLPDITAAAGATVTIPIGINDVYQEDYAIFQVDFICPEEIEVIGCEKGELVDESTETQLISGSDVLDGRNRYRMIVANFTTGYNEPVILGDEGTILYVTVKLPADASGEYAISLEEAQFVKVGGGSANTVYPDNVTATLTVNGLCGDVNGDSIVDVADVTLLIQAILNNSPINLATADMNGDGEVDVADVTLLIANILNN